MSDGAEDRDVSASETPRTRAAVLADVGAILDVQRRAGRADSPEFAKATSSAIDDPDRLVVVGEIEGRLAGWAATKYWPNPEGTAPAGHYLMGVTVVPEHRRRGLGRALIAHRLEWISERSDFAMFFANARNEASIAAHRAWSFEEIASGEEFRGVRFSGDVGGLFRASLHSPTAR